MEERFQKWEALAQVFLRFGIERLLTGRRAKIIEVVLIFGFDSRRQLKDLLMTNHVLDHRQQPPCVGDAPSAQSRYRKRRGIPSCAMIA
jgi:hypothetical protein